MNGADIQTVITENEFKLFNGIFTKRATNEKEFKFWYKKLFAQCLMCIAYNLLLRIYFLFSETEK